MEKNEIIVRDLIKREQESVSLPSMVDYVIAKLASHGSNRPASASTGALSATAAPISDAPLHMQAFTKSDAQSSAGGFNPSFLVFPSDYR